MIETDVDKTMLFKIFAILPVILKIRSISSDGPCFSFETIELNESMMLIPIASPLLSKKR